MEGLKTERYITDERAGLKYELVGDHYLIAGENEPEERSIACGVSGIFGISRRAGGCYMSTC